MEGWDLDKKFMLIASQLLAEPLGLCFLIPEVEYPIVKIERRCFGVIVFLLITKGVNDVKFLH